MTLAAVFNNEVVSSNHELINSFLAKSLKQSLFQLLPIPGDASLRKYYRIKTQNDISYILMDCSKEPKSLLPFIKIAEFLQTNDFSAPKIHNIDHLNGLMLLEDFGNISIGGHLKDNLHQQEEVYKLIIDLLVVLQKITPPSGLPIYNKELLLSELILYLDWYIPYVKGTHLTDGQKEEFCAIWEQILDYLPPLKPCIVLRDFHVENMLLLNRDHIKAIGLIDFQDALIGSPIYDLVSLLEDARIEVSQDMAHKVIDYYLLINQEFNKTDIYLSYYILGAQRNSRILGIFARQALKNNNKSYLHYMPRVLSYLSNDLSYADLQPLKLWMQQNALI